MKWLKKTWIAIKSFFVTPYSTIFFEIDIYSDEWYLLVIQRYILQALKDPHGVIVDLYNYEINDYRHTVKYPLLNVGSLDSLLSRLSLTTNTKNEKITVNFTIDIPTMLLRDELITKG